MTGLLATALFTSTLVRRTWLRIPARCAMAGMSSTSATLPSPRMVAPRVHAQLADYGIHRLNHNLQSPTRTIHAGTIARVSGTRRRTTVPTPCCDSTSTEPPTRSTWERTTSMPTPRPEIWVTCGAVDKPASKTRSMTSRSVMEAACSPLRRPDSTARASKRSLEIPAPSSRTSMMAHPSCCRTDRRMTPSCGLPDVKRSHSASIP